MDFSLQCNKVAKSKHRDRLSELPDSLLLVILSLLQMKDVVATTILSKRWKNLWTTVPCLDFWYHSYDLHEYRSFIYGALAQWRGPKILKFCIAFSYFYPRACDLDSWMLFAIEKQVPDLSILLGRLRDWDSEYYPPQRLYSCSWITKLSLSYCKLKIHEKVQWYQLKSLTIEASNSFTEDSMDNLLSGAPLLEELILFIRIITDSFNIRSTSLKRLRFGCDDRCFGTATVHSVLRIWAPNLLTLEFSGIIYGACFLDVPSLTNADLYFLDYRKEKLANSSPYKMLHHVFQSVCHVENITLSKWCIEFLLHMKNNDMVVHFPNAKFLKLYTGEEIHKMLAVLEMFPNLMSLIAELEYPQSGYSFVSKTIVSLLHLKTVKISWSLWCPSIFPLTEVLLENAHMLEKMVLRLTNHEVDPEGFILASEKVLSMRKSSPYAKVIISKD